MTPLIRLIAIAALTVSAELAVALPILAESAGTTATATVAVGPNDRTERIQRLQVQRDNIVRQSLDLLLDARLQRALLSAGN